MSTIHSLVLGLGLVWPGTDPEDLSNWNPARLREVLQDREHPLRQSQAALLLVQSPNPEAEKMVRQGLRQLDAPPVFVALADAVRHTQDARFAEELLGALASRSPTIRQAAVDGIAALGGTEVINRLHHIADDPVADPVTRRAAVLALGRGGSRHAVIILLNLLSSESQVLRKDAADALANLTGHASGDDLEKWRKWWEQHKDQTEEQWLAERLSYQAARSMRLENDLDRARSQIVRLHQQLYARLQAEERYGHVETASDSEDPAVRGLAVTWIAELFSGADALRSRRLVELLLRLSQDNSSDVQRAAVLALGGAADRRAVERLGTLLREGSVPVRTAAARALAQQINTTPTQTETLRNQIVPLLQKALDDPALEVVVEAAEDLGALGVAEASPVLTSLLRHSSESVRQAAAQALERVADPGVFDGLTQRLGDPSAKVRFSLVGALGHAGGDGRKLTVAQRELLVSQLENLLLHDADPSVRSRAATVLGECGLPSILPLLWRRVLAAEDSRVQEKAWNAMIEMLARTADFQLVQEWDRKLAEGNQPARRLQLLAALLARWQQREDTRSLVTSTEELLVPVQLEQGKWSAAFPLVRDLLAQPVGEVEASHRLRWLLTVGEQALHDGNRADARRAVQEAGPFLAGRDTLAAQFQRLEARIKTDEP